MDAEQIYLLIYQIAVIIVALFAGGKSVPLIKYLKDRLNTSGDWTLAIVAFVSTLTTIATMVVGYTISPEAITIENFSTIMVAVVLSSQVRYRMLLDQLKEVEKNGI